MSVTHDNFEKKINKSKLVKYQIQCMVYVNKLNAIAVEIITIFTKCIISVLEDTTTLKIPNC